jgi:hypothetical protein
MWLSGENFYVSMGKESVNLSFIFLTQCTRRTNVRADMLTENSGHCITFRALHGPKNWEFSNGRAMKLRPVKNNSEWSNNVAW